MLESRLGYKPPSSYSFDLFLLLSFFQPTYTMHVAPSASPTACQPCLRESLWGEVKLFKAMTDAQD